MKESVTTIRVGHSPDSDDAFMFYALTHDRLDTGGLRFVHQLEDIETLNRRALEGELEVSAVSIHAFAHLADRYALLASGASMGDRYGPTLVTREPTTLDDLRGPDDRHAGQADVGLPDAPALPGQGRAGDGHAVRPDPARPWPRGRSTAGLLIHEGQLYYGDQGLHKVLDLGQWWFEQTGLPLPLGGNVVRKDLGEALVLRIAGLLKQSIATPWSTAQEALDYALRYARDLDPALADRFVGHVRQRLDGGLRPPGTRGGPAASGPRRGSGFSPGAR